MPILLENVVNYDGQGVTIYSEDGHTGCRGCEMVEANISCSAPSTCSGKIWKEELP